MKKSLVILAVVLLVTGAAMAQNTTGVLNVTGTINSSIYVTVDSLSSYAALTNGGTNNATLGFGNVSMFGGTVPSGVTFALQGTDPTKPDSFSLQTNFGVKVGLFNGGNYSTGYGLKATLSNTADGLTWTLDGKNLSTAQTVTGGAMTDFSKDVSHTLNVTIPAGQAAGSISNTITLVATAS